VRALAPLLNARAALLGSGQHVWAASFSVQSSMLGLHPAQADREYSRPLL